LPAQKNIKSIFILIDYNIIVRFTQLSSFLANIFTRMKKLHAINGTSFNLLDNGERHLYVYGNIENVLIIIKTLYTSPYLVMTEHEYTKHYFIEGERVCSKVGGGFGPADMPPTSPPLEFIVGDEDHLAEGLKKYTTRNIECTGYTGSWDLSEILEPAYDMGNECEIASYFYHPDHLGSAAFISDFQGQAEQHLQYLPFGELWVNQQNYYFNSRYKFSAKELDSESGYNYFGARYYDSELSNWLSVDPLADERSWVSPYSYVQNSPVMRVDPSGALDDNYVFDKQSGKYKRRERNNQPDQIVLENSKTGSRDYYAFNDAEVDVERIKKGKIKFAQVISREKIDYEIEMSGALDADDKFTFIERESRLSGEKSIFSSYSKGKLDFVGSVPELGTKESKHTLFLISNAGTTNSNQLGTGYNRKDFGNFLWGASGKAMGFKLPTLRAAAHYRAATGSKTDNPNLKYKPYDSKADQRAIKSGYKYY
jgi:RHS repeat-associated protein